MKMDSPFAYWFSVVAMLIAGVMQASATNTITLNLNPTDANGIRILDSSAPFLLGYEQVFSLPNSPPSINNNHYDVTVMGFGISAIPQNSTITSATLGFLARNLDPSSIRAVGVYTFYGESVVQPNDFYAGSLSSSFLSYGTPAGYQNESVDLTSIVVSAVNADEQMLDLKLEELDNGTRLDLEGPYQLSVVYDVPEPETLITLSCGLALISVWRKRAV